jgi:hypothetical protein
MEEEEKEEEEALETVGVEEDKKVKHPPPPLWDFRVNSRLDVNGLNKKLHLSSQSLDATDCRKSEWHCFHNKSNRSHK